MSGICAVWRPDDPGRTAEMLAAISAGLAAYDGDAIVQQELDGAGGVGVAARFEPQQIYRANRVILACDAEIYNEDELREAAGVAAGSTAQLLTALYERSGIDFVRKVRGSFSLVVWDKRQERLFAAVDHFGVCRLV